MKLPIYVIFGFFTIGVVIACTDLYDGATDSQKFGISVSIMVVWPVILGYIIGKIIKHFGIAI